MIWFTWRQFRIPAAITAGALAVFGVLLLISARSVADLHTDVAACQGDCAGVVQSFLIQVRSGLSGNVYNAATGLTYALPALIGIFWGAPLVAREVETGTHRLAWNQSVTRTRWLAIKLAVVGAATAAATGVLAWSVTAWAQRIDSATGDRVTPALFGARGIVPVAYAVFAFTLGVAIGMVVRRTVVAMGATLGIYAAAVAVMPLWIRGHLIPPRHETKALDIANLGEVMISSDGTMRAMGEPLPDTWVLANETLTPTGQVFTGPSNPSFCGPDAPARGCDDWIGTLGLRQDLVYHPGSHFWPLQWAEAGIFLGLAALLVGFCFWWIRRRLT
jgi:hypothetical protein